MIFDLYDIFQNIRISETARKADRARDMVDDVELRVETLERRLAVLKMTSEALWTFIKRHHNLADEDLVSHLKEIEAREMLPDGREVQEEPRHCPACGRTLQKSTGSCLKCGFKSDPKPFTSA